MSGLENEISEGGIEIALVKGSEYKFCTCGHSKQLPLCDNTHREINEENGTSYKSFKVCPREDCKIKIYSTNWLSKKKK